MPIVTKLYQDAGGMSEGGMGGHFPGGGAPGGRHDDEEGSGHRGGSLKTELTSGTARIV